MSWLLIGVLTWGVLASVAGVVIGLALRQLNEDVASAAWTDDVDSILRRSGWPLGTRTSGVATPSSDG